LEPYYNKVLNESTVRAEEFTTLRKFYSALAQALQDENTGFLRKVSENVERRYLHHHWNGPVDVDGSLNSKENIKVEGIIQLRTVGVVNQYLVKWHRVPVQKATWETVEVFQDCQQILNDYLNWTDETSLIPAEWKTGSDTTKKATSKQCLITLEDQFNIKRIVVALESHSDYQVLQLDEDSKKRKRPSGVTNFKSIRSKAFKNRYKDLSDFINDIEKLWNHLGPPAIYFKSRYEELRNLFNKSSDKCINIEV
jgi:Chromo (CHRromatin Organisation MOdifier) domain